jgi:hypothetical protein
VPIRHKRSSSQTNTGKSARAYKSNQPGCRTGFAANRAGASPRKITVAWIENRTVPTNWGSKLAARAHVKRPDKATGFQSGIPISVLFGGQLPLCPISPARSKRWLRPSPRECAADLRTDQELSLVVIRQLHVRSPGFKHAFTIALCHRSRRLASLSDHAMQIPACE